ncbi:unnamed protein product, partial [Ixodes pacificus]
HDCPRTCRDVPSPSKNPPRKILTVQGRAPTGYGRPRTCRDKPSPTSRFKDLSREALTVHEPAASEHHRTSTCHERTSQSKDLSPQDLTDQGDAVTTDQAGPVTDRQWAPPTPLVCGAHWMGVQKSQKKEMAQLGQLSFRMAE